MGWTFTFKTLSSESVFCLDDYKVSFLGVKSSKYNSKVFIITVSTKIEIQRKNPSNRPDSNKRVLADALTTTIQYSTSYESFSGILSLK